MTDSASEDEIEFPDLSPLIGNTGEEDEMDPLEPFADVDYEDEPITLQCEDSKR